MDKVKTIIISVLATVIVVFGGLYLLGSQSEKKTPPPPAAAPTAVTPTTPSPATSAPTEKPSAAALALTQTFDDAKAGYVMQYPADWIYEKPDKSATTVIFSGKQGTPAYRATLNIQNLLTTQAGGKYADIAAVVKDLKQQLTGGGAVFAGEQALTYTTQKGQQLQGAQFLVEYTLKGEKFRQWQVVIPNPDGKYLHALAYTAPADLYADYEATAQAMIQSWKMKE